MNGVTEEVLSEEALMNCISPGGGGAGHALEAQGAQFLSLPGSPLRCTLLSPRLFLIVACQLSTPALSAWGPSPQLFP